MIRFQASSGSTSAAERQPASNYSLAGRVQGWLRGRNGREQRLRLIETLPLGPKRSVAMIECDGQRFLAGMGADGVTTLVPVTDGTNSYRSNGVA